MLDADYPQWICAPCGELCRPAGIATWRPGTCGICGRKRAVTEPRDFGHLRDGWRDRRDGPAG